MTKNSSGTSPHSPLRAVIVDDEEHCIKTLAWELKGCEAPVELVTSFTSGIEAVAQLPSIKPDLLFLDIEMPKLSGFDLLNTLQSIEGLPPHVIFTTAYSEHAVRAFKYSAVDYLLKPVDHEELCGALSRLTSGAAEGGNKSEEDSKTNGQRKLKVLFENLDAARSGRSLRLSLPSADGWDLVAIEDIVRCSSDGSYTDVHLVGGNSITVSRNIKHIQDSLPPDAFLRVHNQHLVNVEHVRRFVKQDGGLLVMSDGSDVAVARSRKDLVMNLVR